MIDGAAAGFRATFWMSALMLLARKLLPTPKLPPRKIVEAAVKKVSGEPASPRAQKQDQFWRISHSARQQAQFSGWRKAG